MHLLQQMADRSRAAACRAELPTAAANVIKLFFSFVADFFATMLQEISPLMIQRQNKLECYFSNYSKLGCKTGACPNEAPLAAPL